MPMVSMRQLLDHAAENGYGIPAFNVNNLEQVQAVMSAAHEVGAPVILQASAGARKYAGESFIKHLIQAALEAYPHIPLVMHQDHGQSRGICQGAIDLGFGSVMMDGSLQEDGKTPASFDYNMSRSRARWSTWRTRSVSPWKANWAASARWKPAWPARKTAMAPKASSITRRC
jgi:fructose-bisphosphate aldolase class II